MVENFEEKKEIKELLERGEVKTMAKDVAQLREKEAEAERERIAVLSTEKEAKIEKEKREVQLGESEERKKLEEEAKRKEEESFKKIEEERLQEIKKMEEGEKEEKEKELFEFVGEKTKEIWKKEEEERKKFLEKLEAKGVGETAPEASALEVKKEEEKPLIIPLPPKRPSSHWKLLIRGLIVFIILIFISSFSYWYLKIRKVEIPAKEAKPPAEETVLTPEAILANLSLEKRVGQLFIIGFEGEVITPEIKNIFQKIPPGGVILFSKNIKNEEQTKILIEDLQKLSQEATGLPLFVAVDQEGGPVDRIQFLKEKTPQSAIGNKEEAFRVGFEKGTELKILGFNLNLAPVLDQLNPGDFLYPRSFQKNLEISGELGEAIIEGQKEAGIFSAIKHFPGYTGITFNPEEKPGRVSKLPGISQFKQSANANPEFVMVVNAIVGELDPLRRFLFSEKNIEFLKESLPGDYLIMTDDLSQNVFLQKFSLEDIVAIPINSGVNILVFSDFRENPAKALEVLLDAAKKGKVSQGEIEQSVLKIIKIKQRIK